MQKLIKKIKLTLLSFVLFLPLINAQFEAGVFLGAANYQGDLADGIIRWQESQPAFGAMLRYTPNRFLTIRANVIQSKLAGSDLRSSDPGTRYRGFTFKSTVREFSVVSEFNFLGQSNENNFQGSSTLFNPYIFAGLGIASNDGEPVAPPDTRPYPFPEDGATSVVPAFPMGLGIKIQFRETISLGIDWGTRLTFSDYLDGVSKTGNPKKNDWYMFGGLTLTYSFGGDGY